MAVMVSQNIFECLANMLQNSKYVGLLVKDIDKFPPPPLRHTLLDTAYKLSLPMSTASSFLTRRR